MLLTMKDTQRIEVLRALMDARLTLAQVAQAAGDRSGGCWRARAEGLAGLLHGSCWRTPANRSDDRPWRQVLNLKGEKYQRVNNRHLQEPTVCVTV